MIRPRLLLIALVLATVAPSTSHAPAVAEEPPVTQSPRPSPSAPLTWTQVLESEFTDISLHAAIGDHAGVRAALAARAPLVRRLALLFRLYDTIGALAEDGLTRLAVHFMVADGDLAPDILAALREAGFAARADAYAAAMAAFGPWPVDAAERCHRLACTEPDRTTPTQAAVETRSLAFGTPAAFATDLAAWIAATPELAAFLVEAHTRVPDRDRLSVLFGRLAAEVDGFAPVAEIDARLAALDPARRTVLLLLLYHGEILNGGMHQFFFNSSGAFAPMIADALAEHGIDRQADALHRAIAHFPAPYERHTESRRAVHFPSRDWSDWDAALDALTDDTDIDRVEEAALAVGRRAGILPP